MLTIPKSHWSPIQFRSESDWTLGTVAHLHRRAGFASSWQERQRDVEEGFEKSLRRILQPSLDDKTQSRFDRFEERLGGGAVGSGRADRLQAWWVYHMLFSGFSLRERLTLMWHDHFATSLVKVEDLGLMRHQNITLRQHALGKFGDLLKALVRDPALLIYLDAPFNRKGLLNENLGRELMELFTLGIGNYSEQDVKEVSRALTGWTVSEYGSFDHRPSKHDPEAKTVLGQRGDFDGDDVVAILLKHPATADRLAGKLIELFMGEGVVPSEARSELAQELATRELDVSWAVETILRSRLFYSKANRRSRINSPVEFVIGSVRSLELEEGPLSTLSLAHWITRMGQDLFRPPNVGGWKGGRAWLADRALLARCHFAEALVGGELFRPPCRWNPLNLAHERATETAPDAAYAFFQRLLQDRVAEEMPEPLRSQHWGEDAAREAVSRLLVAPAAQVS